MTFPNRPKTKTHNKEYCRVNNAAPYGQCTKGCHARGKGLTGRTYEGKTGHGCPKYTHKKHEGSNGPAGHKVILARTLKKSAAINSKPQKNNEISTHNQKWDG